MGDFENPVTSDRQLVLVDESGDPGMNLSGGSSTFFVVTAVLFQKQIEAEACEKRIDGIRQELGLPPAAEFRFQKTSDQVRKGFLSGVLAFDFSYVAIVFDKRKLAKESLPKEDFQTFVTGMAFEFLRPHLKEAFVKIDRSGSQDFGKRMSKHLTRVMNGPGGRLLVKRVKSVNSAGSNMIQLVDMVCGAVARSFRSDKKNHAVFRDLIRSKELAVELRP